MKGLPRSAPSGGAHCTGNGVGLGELRPAQHLEIRPNRRCQHHFPARLLDALGGFLISLVLPVPAVPRMTPVSSAGSAPASWSSRTGAVDRPSIAATTPPHRDRRQRRLE